MGTYSFLNITATLSGPGGIVNLGVGACLSDEGITISQSEDRGVMSTGADGCVMHSLRAAKGGAATVRLQKTSPTNAILMSMFNIQASSSANWGGNTLVISDTTRGDIVTAREVAIRKVPDISYKKDGDMVEWSLLCGYIDYVIGNGKPNF